MDKARKQAFILLDGIIRGGKYSNLSLKDGLDGFEARDRAFISALVYGTLDKKINLEYIISLYAKGRIQPKIKNILLLGAYQIMYMDKVPDYSAVKTSVDLCENVGKGMLKGYVNGVLRKIAQNKDNVAYPENKAEFISVKYSYPLFFVRELISDLGQEEAEKFCSFEGKLTTSVRTDKDKTDEKILKYGGEKGIYFDNFFYTSDINGIFYDNSCFIQSEASYSACLALSPQKGERILDACSAPGGKTVCIASMIKSGTVVACDKHPHRVELICKNAQRAGYESIIEARCEDMTTACLEGEFDRILIDAPCSGLGVTDKKPEIKNSVTEQSCRELEEIQYALLNNCAKMLKSGGVLVYSTCTVRKRENTDNVMCFLKNNPQFKLDSAEGLFGEKFEKGRDMSKGYIQLYPHKDKTDGFFIARMVKN